METNLNLEQLTDREVVHALLGTKPKAGFCAESREAYTAEALEALTSSDPLVLRRALWRSAALVMDGEEGGANRMLGGGHLPRQHAGRGCLAFVLVAFRRRELVAAGRAAGEASGDHRLALRAFLGRRLTIAISRLLDGQGIDRPMAQYVAAEVEDQAVLLARRQAEAAADHRRRAVRGPELAQAQGGPRRHAADRG
jgi:hypothetical protein